MRILGVSAFHRDAAAALVVDGQVVAAAQEERFTRLTLDPAFPSRAIRWCLASANLRGEELDRVVFYEKPLRKFERVLARSLRGFPRSGGSFSRSLFLWLGERLWIKNRIAKELGLAAEHVLFVAQAEAELANAFFSSEFEDAALLLLDDVCEWSTTALGRGHGTSVELLLEIRHPHSLGLLASALTQFLGFVPGEEEHKLEALAAFGTPRRSAELERLFRGSGALFELDSSFFRFDDGAATLYGPELEGLLGAPRHSGDPLRLLPGDSGHADLAASLQSILEERALTLARDLARRTASSNLCLAGLLAQNRRLVQRLATDGPFERVSVPSAPGKAGGALGAALFAHHALSGGERRRPAAHYACGESIDERAEPGAKELGSTARALEELAMRLQRGELVAWARGAMEFGTHSLGRRCALGAVARAKGPARLHAALQSSEAFLPCRIAVPEERVQEYFELPERQLGLARQAHVLAAARPRLVELVPEGLAPDGRAWPQVVTAESDRELHELLARLGRESGVPLLWLTDLALRGSPLVRNEADAVEAFGRSGLDALLAGTRLYVRA